MSSKNKYVIRVLRKGRYKRFFYDIALVKSKKGPKYKAKIILGKYILNESQKFFFFNTSEAAFWFLKGVIVKGIIKKWIYKIIYYDLYVRKNF